MKAEKGLPFIDHPIEAVEKHCLKLIDRLFKFDKKLNALSHKGLDQEGGNLIDVIGKHFDWKNNKQDIEYVLGLFSTALLIMIATYKHEAGEYKLMIRNPNWPKDFFKDDEPETY